MKFNNCVVKYLFSLLTFLFFVITISAQCPQLVWEDNFDGTEVDQSKWSFQTQDGCNIDPTLCGWGNNELQWYLEKNATVENGNLVITAKRETVSGKNYTSARLLSKGKGDWTYGRFEASIKLPTGKGLWPAFWMLSTNEPYGGWPQSGEIDIMELIGSEPDVAHGTVHYGSPWPNNQSKGESYQLNQGTFLDEFHEFAIEWETNEIRWYVDDYLYSTKTKNEILSWPFDQDMHFLLNVAVGGSWPGSPDASTTFPQTMEVDYVRVYDGYFPSISGERKVTFQAENIQYKINNAADATSINWTLPDGATIVEGEGTSDVTINWGNSGGTLSAEVTTSCGVETINMEVFVEPSIVKTFSFENFDEPGKVTLGTVTGTFQDNTNNPAPNEINSSQLVGKYTRDMQSQFDILVYEISDLEDVGGYLTGDNKFFIDIYTDASIGTEILLQMENKSLAAGDYPVGRHSRYQVKTTKQNEWERLELVFLDRPDANIANTIIDQFVILFAPGLPSGNTFHFDNFDSYGESTSVNTKEIKQTEISLFRLSPNPVTDFFRLENISKSTIEEVQIMTISGQVIWKQNLQLNAGQTEQIQLQDLPKGIYFLNALSEEGLQSSEKLVVLRNE